MDLKASEERKHSNRIMHPGKIITLRASFAGVSPDRESSSAGDRQKKTRLALKQEPYENIWLENHIYRKCCLLFP
jgi:hypothetical protein